MFVRSVAVVMIIGMGTGIALHAASVPKPLTGDETVILSFEKEEVAGFAKGMSAYAPELFGDAYLVPTMQFRIKKGDATHGEWAFFCPITKGGENKTLKWRKFGQYNPLLDFRGRNGPPRDILTTFDRMGDDRSWLAKLPGGKDWSGYHMIRMDVKCASAIVMRLDIEDEEIMPAVRRRFRIPAGTWVTVELDLRKAVEARDLDLSKMCNFWVFIEEIPEPANVLLDNIRLVKEAVEPKLPLIVDKGSYEAEPRVYAIHPIESEGNRYGYWKIVKYPEEDAPLPTERDLKLPEERGPWRLEVHKNIGKGEHGHLLVSSGPLAKNRYAEWSPVAFDARRIIVPFHVLDGRVRQGTRVAVTEDGGTTWTGLGGEALPSWVFQGNMKSSVGASVGHDGIYVIGKPSCFGFGYPGDRIFVRRISISNEGWKAYPATPAGQDLRHCASEKTILKLASGRIWATWPLLGRLGGEIAAKYSDDGGRTWHSWRPGKRAMLPGSATVKERGDKIYLTPFGERVACVTRGGSGTSVWVFDGTAWSDPLYNRGIPRVSSVAGLKGKQLLLACMYGKGVYRFDGTAFEKEYVAGHEGNGCLSVCGDNVLLFAAKSGEDFKKLLCWRRSAEGVWTGPEEVVSEEKSISSFVPGSYSPEAFTPLVWTCEGEPWIKIMLVPAGQDGKEEGTRE